MRYFRYNLSYPDHLYCKHHRYYNWHDQGVGLPGEVDGVLGTTSVTGFVGTNTSALSGMSSSHVGGLPMTVHYGHHKLNNSGSTIHHTSALSSVGLHGSMENEEPVEDYYTINETDNLEINWPQDTVATASAAT